MGDRIKWIDTLKGFGIISIVLYHSPLGSDLNAYVYAFCVPVFFFASGYVFSPKRYTGIGDFLLKKIKSLLIPYCLLSIISVLANFLILQASFDYKHIFIDFIKSERNNISFNIAIWFLTALFVVEVVYYILIYFIKKPWIIGILSFFIGLFAFNFTYSSSPIKSLLWSCNFAGFYLIFFALGNMSRKYNFIKRKNKFFLVFAVICMIFNASLLLVPGKFYEFLSIYSSLASFFLFPLYMNYLIKGIVTITTLVVLAKIFEESKLLKKLGGNSLIIMGLHTTIAFNIIYETMLMFHLQIPNSNIYGFYYTFLALLILMPFCYCINRYCSFILGKISLVKIKWCNSVE